MPASRRGRRTITALERPWNVRVNSQMLSCDFDTRKGDGLSNTFVQQCDDATLSNVSSDSAATEVDNSTQSCSTGVVVAAPRDVIGHLYLLSIDPTHSSHRDLEMNIADGQIGGLWPPYHR